MTRVRTMEIIEKLNGKKILIWGYGREGKSTERFLKTHCPDAQVEIYEGTRDSFDIDRYDLVIKSPGIVLWEDDPKITSQTELFLEAYREHVVGITGTKGKSTTSAMLYTVLKHCGKDALLVGNIGQPCLDDYDLVQKDTIVVYEMSCHQLWHTHVSPHTAVFLNLFEEHLDYYKTLENYFTAKSHITAYQQEGDVYYRGFNVPEIRTAATVVPLPQVPERQYELSINGTHNQYNADVVCRIAAQYGCAESDILAGIRSFTGLPHRLQFAGTADGLRWYDDSISTIPQAAIGAAESLPEARTILVGGMDRGIDYNLLEEYIRKRRDLYFILAYDSGKRIFEELTEGNMTDAGVPNFCYVPDLSAQVETARKVTPEGFAVVLSPAAASYGYFKNFEERGDAFCRLAVGGNR